MDYGPFLTASIEAPHPATNIAFKGIAIRLTNTVDASQTAAVLFDTDLLRYAAGWTGGFVALKGVVFDGEHWAYPQIAGRQVYGNPPLPGWAGHGSFKDPRGFIYGPLPRDWAHWKGLFVHGEQVVLAYSVGQASVLELAGLEPVPGRTVFSRTLDIMPAGQELTLQVLYDSARVARRVQVDTLEPAQPQVRANSALIILAPPEMPGRDAVAPQRGLSEGLNPDPDLLAVAVVNAPPDAAWVLPGDGNVRLALPGTTTPARFKLLTARIPKDGLPAFVRCLKESPDPPELRHLTRGGPPHWLPALSTHGRLGAETGPYAIDTITWPDDNPWDSWMRFGSFDFFRDATRAAISTWSGDVWVVSGLDEKLDHVTWRRFATGLYQPLGLKIVRDQIYVLGRDQITRLHDLNGDGEADWYENFNNDTMNTEHFHEFVLDLQTDAQGDFYYMKGARHARDALHPQHGTLMKVSSDGSQSEIIAKGFRAPNGLEISPRGEFFSTDQEGYWMPANRLNLIKPGGFYGNAWSWFPEGKPGSFDPPICWIHPKVDRSPSTMAWVTSDRWGPLKDQLLSFSYGVGRVFLVPHETVNGVVQGGIVPLPVEFDTGLMRSRFNKRDGQLYVCGLYGWAGNKTTEGGFYRIRYTGKPLRLPNELHVASNGVVLRFTEALEPDAATDPGNYGVEVWNYRWTQNYGSPDYRLNGDKGRDRLSVASARLSADGRTVFLELPGIRPVMQMNIQMNLRAADGAPIQTFVHNTIHSLGSRPGEAWVGPAPATAAKRAPRLLRHEAPGLALTFTTATADDRSAPASDTRPVRLVALNVPADAAPTPFLSPGPFRASWTGFIKLDLNGTYSFHAIGAGKVRVTVNQQTAIPLTELTADAATYPPVLLRSGLNPVEVAFESPARGDARLRLFWSEPELLPGPVPPTALVHEAREEAVRQGELRRMGRQLFATRHCAKCHAPAAPFQDRLLDAAGKASPEQPSRPSRAMPELAFEPPSLEDCGLRLNAEWLRLWLADPEGQTPEATMPRCLAGSKETADIDARDLAAFLVSLGRQPGGSPAATGAPEATAFSREADRRAGEALYAKLGCVACHVMPGDAKLDADNRLSLGHVRTKWLPQALAEYLRSPARLYPSTRMPDFNLEEPEARALTAYLLARADAPRPPGPVQPAANLERGKELAGRLGCANCHKLPGIQSREIARSLESLAGKEWRSGCLADERTAAGTAPDFRFTPDERQALRGLLLRDLESLRREDPVEFASRQTSALRCTACHQRDAALDFWSALEAHGAAQTPKAANPYDDDEPAQATIHRQRPPLTWAGEKLRAEWVETLLRGQLGYKPRPKLEARMPAFAAYAAGLARGFALEHGVDANSLPERGLDAGLAAAGRALIQKGAFGCVDCHAVAEQPALAGADTATINFVHVKDRLRRDYFDRYVLDPQRWLPGTMMPRFVNDEGLTGITSHFAGDGRRQFGAIWEYLRAIALNSDPARAAAR